MKSRASRSKGNSRKTSRQESSKGSSATSSASTSTHAESKSSNYSGSLHRPGSMTNNVSHTLEQRGSLSSMNGQGIRINRQVAPPPSPAGRLKLNFQAANNPGGGAVA
jgi:hypothetical protein